MERSNQRERYRIEYPASGAPSLVVDGRALRVLDCSESGLRYALPDDEPLPDAGDEVRGTAHFKNGDEVPLRGVIAQVYGRSAAVHFTGSGIPFSTILKEQHRLRRSYLGRFDGRSQESG